MVVLGLRQSKRRSRFAMTSVAISRAIEPLESRLLMSAANTPVTATTVDPADGLRLSVNDEQPSNILGDSTKSGSFTSWTVTGASNSSNSTTLTATAAAAGTPVTLAIANIATTVTPLEYAYYDYVQLSLTLPTNFTGGPITFYYGTNDPLSTAPSQSGITTTNVNRQFTIPAAQVEGGTHVYRINVGKLVFWEGYLTNLELSIPTSAAGQTETLTYAEVGDLPNSTLAVSPTTQNIDNPAGYLQYPTTANGGAYNISPTDGTWHAVQSKHFVYYYDTAANAGGYANQAQAAHNALEMAEQAQRIYTQVLDFGNVFGWAKNLNGDTTPYKLNITSWFPGSFSGGFYFNVDSSETEDTTGPGTGYMDPEEPFASTAHEFGHVTDSQNNNYLNGGDFESHANWYREQWINWYAPKWTLDGDAVSSYDPIANEDSNLRQDDQRLIYNDWRIYTPLEYYAAQMGLDPDLVTKLWSIGGTNLTPYDKLAEILPETTNTNNLSVKDVAAMLMAYWPTLDFPVRADMESNAFQSTSDFTTAQELANFNYEDTSYLEPDADDTGWYTVPYERAPESYGYMTHVLTPTPGSTSMSVTVKGLPSTDSTADWRYVLEDVSNYGTMTPTVNSFSPVYDNGQTGTINLLSSTDTVLLVVTATPGDTTLDLTDFDNTARNTQAATRLVYPYEVQVTGGAPATGTALQIAYTRSTSGKYWTNSNGSTGGWVDSTATVAAGAYIAPGAEVLGNANVGAGVKIEDYAVVSGNATVSGNAIVAGYAVVAGYAQVTGNAVVEDHAFVTSGALIEGSAVVEQYAYVPAYQGDVVTVTGNAIVRGVAEPTGGTLSGSAIVDYDYTSDFTLSTGVNTNNHPYDEDFDTYYSDTQVMPAGLIASYRINETSGNELFDEYGALNAELRGTPTRVYDATRNSQVLSLDGATQYAILDRSLADLTTGTYSMAVNPSSATANQPLLYFGSSANTYAELVARDANGFAEFTISVNGVVQQLESTVAVPLNAWTNIAVTFGNGTATFYINGAPAGTTAMTFTPASVMTSDSYQTPIALYLGRDASGNYFAGELDDIRFYDIALPPSEINTEIARSGATLGSFYTSTPVAFNSTATAATLPQSGVHDGLVRTISAWINPTSSPTATDLHYNDNYYTPIVDSTDERYETSGANGSGLGIESGFYVVRLDGYNATGGMWVTQVPVVLNQWSQVTLTFNGSVANLYINGALRASTTYTATAAMVAGKNYRIGFGQTIDDSTTAQNSYFNGQIFDLTISDEVIAPTTTLPTGWTSQDISTGAAGNTSFGSIGNTWAVYGAGSGVTGTADKFHLTSTSESGNGSITAQVSNPTLNSTGTINSSAAAGVMLRASNASGAVNAMIAITPANGLIFSYRTTLNGSTTTTTSTAVTAGPVWLRLTRSGSSVSAYYSTDDVNFTQLGSTVTLSALPTVSLAGLAVSSRVNATLVQSVFANVSVTSTSGPTIATAPTATAITGTSANLSVLGSDPAGESSLIYTWTQTGTWPAPVAFSINGTNAAKNTSVTFCAVGTYQFQVAAYDTAGQVVLSGTVTVVINQTIGAISPTSATVAGGGTQQFSATDQFGNLIAATSVNWTTSLGTISTSGVYSAPARGTAATVTASLGSGSQSATISIVSPALWYQFDSVTSSTITDSSGNGYTGTAQGTYKTNYNSSTGEIDNAIALSGSSTANGYVNVPVAAVKSLTDFTISGWVYLTSTPNTWGRLFDFSNGTTTKYMYLTPDSGGGVVQFGISTNTNANEQDVSSTFSLTAKTWYFLAVTLTNDTATLYVNGAVAGTNTGVTLTPASVGITSAYLGKSIFGDPQFQGSIDDFRIYNSAQSAATIAAMYAVGTNAAAHIPTLATAAAASPSTVTGTTTTLTALGTESAGESNLTYTWATTGTPPAPVTFSTNGTNPAKSDVATFTKAGTYNFTVTISDPLGYSVTSAVSVVVNQTATTVAVTPASPGARASGSTTQFSATVYDQFGAVVSSPVTWSATGGTVNSSTGLFTAGSTAGSFSVTATAGSISGIASGTVVPSSYSSSSSAGYYVELASDGLTEEIWAGVPGAVGPAFGSPTYSIPLANLTSLAFSSNSSGIALTIDATNGVPVPSGGITFTGNSSNAALSVIGTPQNNTVSIGANQLVLDGKTISYTGTNAIAITLGAGTNTLTQTAQPGGGAALSLTDPSATDTLSINSGIFTFNAPAAGAGIVQLPLASLIVGAGANVVVNSAASHADRYLMELSSLSLGAANAVLDLGANDLDAQAIPGTTLGTLGSHLISSAANSDSSHLKTLGIIQNNQDGAALFAASNLFDGILLPGSSDILVKFTYFGDATLDGTVASTDYSRIDYGYLEHLTGWLNGDFNNDGIVNGSDYTLIDNAFNTQGASLAAQIGSAEVAVAPETQINRAAPTENHGNAISLSYIGPPTHASFSDRPLIHEGLYLELTHTRNLLNGCISPRYSATVFPSWRQQANLKIRKPQTSRRSDPFGLTSLNGNLE